MAASPDILAPICVEICNQKGLHARAAAKFVKTVEEYDACVSVRKLGFDDATVSGQSILALMMLAADKGSTLEITATGPNAEPALAALQTLVSARFGEDQ